MQSPAIRKSYFIFTYLLMVAVIFLNDVCTNIVMGKPPREELLWYKYKKFYKNINDVKEDLDKGLLLHPPDYFSSLEIINEGVGDIDPNNARYYWAAKPGTLGLILEVARKYKLQTHNPEAKLYISGLLRTLEYQSILSQYNNWADLGRSTHTNGATADITVHPLFMKETDKIEKLRSILKELHKTKEVFFIDESSNSCFHICLNPDYEEKYASLFYEISKEYEFSDYYSKKLQLYNNKENIREAMEKGDLVSISGNLTNLPVEISLPDSNSYCSLRPEAAGLLIEICRTSNTTSGEKVILRQLIRTFNQQKEFKEKDPLLPLNSAFVYGMAFQIDISNLTREEQSKFREKIQGFKYSGDLDFIERQDKKVDIVLRPEAQSKYSSIYNKYNNSSGHNSSHINYLHYLYILLSLFGGLIIGFLILRFYKLRQFIKSLQKMKRKKTIRLKKKEDIGEDTSNSF